MLGDDFIGNAPPPDSIKCDVEGAEIEALRDAETLLGTRYPWIIREMHSKENEKAARDLLRRLGCTVETLDDSHMLALKQWGTEPCNERP